MGRRTRRRKRARITSRRKRGERTKIIMNNRIRSRRGRITKTLS
jgi:hypothetical protein